MATARPASKRVEHRQPLPAPESQGGALHLLHVPVPHVPKLHLTMPTGTRGRVLWWGGLAAAAAFGVLDWPVAAVVAAGSWMAEQHAKQGQQPKAEHAGGS